MTSMRAISAVSLGDAGAARPVHADGVHLVEIGHRAIALARGRRSPRSARRRRPSNRRSRTRSASGGSGAARAQQLLEMPDVVVAPDLLLRSRRLRTPSIIELWLSASDRIRQSGSSLAIVAMPRLVGHVARRENERRFACACRSASSGLQLHQRPVCTRDVARSAARPRPSCARRRTSLRSPSGAGPCQDSRSSTRPRHPACRSGCSRAHGETVRLALQVSEDAVARSRFRAATAD